MRPRVVLVHGFATSASRTWRDTGWIDLLTEAGREVVAPDLLGHGSAPAPHDPDAYAGLEGHLAAQLGEEPVDAVGFSLGARTLLTLASREPHRFRRLVLGGVGASLFERDDDERSRIAAALRGEAGDDVNARHFAALSSAPDLDVDALLACIGHERPPLTADDLAAVSVPCLVVIGDGDPYGPADPLVAALGDAGCVVVPGVDHFGLPKAFGFIDAALEFLDASP